MVKKTEIKPVALVKKLRKPRVNIDLVEVEKLLAMQATDAEIAAFFDCTKQAISARKRSDQAFKDAYKRGKDKGKASLRRLMWQKAQGVEGELARDDDGKLCFDDKHKLMWKVPPQAADTTMQIWLSKNILGFADKVEHTGKDGQPIETKNTVINVVSDTAKKLTEQIMTGERTA
jgi:hypothetical protein